MNTDFNKIRKISWLQRWSGSYTFMSCSFWGPQYYRSLKKILGVNFTHTLFVHRKGTVDFYVAGEELHHFGKTLAKKMVKNPKILKKYCHLIITNTDKLSRVMKNLAGKIPALRQYRKFLVPFENHLAYHGFIKETVDYLPTRPLSKYLDDFEQARKYSEKVYSNSEVFFRGLAKAIAKKEKLPADILTCLKQSELEHYLKTGLLPEIKALKQRYPASCLYFAKDRAELFFGWQVKKIERVLLGTHLKLPKKIAGRPAFPGQVRAICRVVKNPRAGKHFKTGEILVTGMTRPEFLPMIKKSSAIITDSGGILSHAAIIARELKIPCVVGTQISTKVLKTGQKISFDGKTGIIKVL